MLSALAVSAVATFFIGFAAHRAAIDLAYRWRLLDYPTTRRRHARATPIVGGISIFSSWAVGLCLFTFLQPDWAVAHLHTLASVGAGLLILLGLGIVDDVKGLGPKPKLLFQSAAAAIVILFEPHAREMCLQWQPVVGLAVWPLAMIWVVGVTNAINLIDGLDGLAGGTSLLVCSSLFLLSSWSGPGAAFAVVATGLLVPAILAFLKFNWHPAKIFLGDNGSLPLGFIIAVTSMMCRPVGAQATSWVMIGSIVLMLGYPILDMGMAVFRRARYGLPLFKADRNHLHYRVLRLGLDVERTAILLLSITLYLQITALCANYLAPVLATLGIAIVGFSVFSLIFLVSSIEKRQVDQLFDRKAGAEGGASDASIQGEGAVAAHFALMMHIELAPLSEAGLFEERERYAQLVESLRAMLKTLIRKEDQIHLTHQRITIVLADFDGSPEKQQVIHDRFSKKIELFLGMVELQVSLATLPITFERRLIRGPRPTELAVRKAQ